MEEYSREAIIQELQDRGINTNNYNKLPAISSDIKSKPPITKMDIVRELKNRGFNEDMIEKALKITPVERKSFWQSLKEELPETGGAIVGGIAGAKYGIPGSIIGAGIGAMGGKGYQKIGEYISGKEPASVKDTVKELGTIGAKQAAFQAIGYPIAKIAGKILAPISDSLIPEYQIAKKTLEPFMPKKRPILLPNEATESRILDIAENVSEASIVGGNQIKRFKFQRNKAINDLIDDYTSQFGQRANPEDIGDAFAMAIEGKLNLRKTITEPLYNSAIEKLKPIIKKVPIEEKIPTTFIDANGNPIYKTVIKYVEQEEGVKVSTKVLKNFAKPLHKISQDLQGIEARNAGDDLIDGIMNLPDEISFVTAKDLRSRLISRVDEFNIINKKAPAIGKAKKLESILHDAIIGTLKKENPEALDIWLQANDIYKQMGKQYDNKFLRRLMKISIDTGTPEVIPARIFQRGAISNIKNVKNAVDESTFGLMKNYYVYDVLKKSITSEGELSGKMLYNNLYGKSGMGEQTLREIFTPVELNNLKNIATTIRIVQEKQQEGTGKIFIQLSQASAGMGLLYKGLTKTAFTILGGPAVIAKIMLSPKGNRWLIEGYKLPVNSPQVISNFLRLTDLSYEIYKDMQMKGELPPITQSELYKLKGKSTLR